jgi:hypothetical protein
MFQARRLFFTTLVKMDGLPCLRLASLDHFQQAALELQGHGQQAQL